MYIILDVGGTNIKYSLMNGSLEVKDSGKIDTPKESFEDFRDAIMNIVDRWVHIPEVEGIGICFPGKVNTESQIIEHGALLTFLCGRHINEIITITRDIPIIIENDAKSAALGELWKGNLEGKNNGAVITLGTGLGGGIIINGDLYRGSNNESGELSFLNNFDTLSRRRVPIAYNCSAVLVVERLKKAMGDDTLTGPEVFEILSNSENEILITIFKDFVIQLCHILYDVQCLFDFDKILIGGGISNQKIVIDTVQSEIKEIALQNDWLRHIPIVENTKFGSRSNQVGLVYKLEKGRYS